MRWINYLRKMRNLRDKTERERRTGFDKPDRTTSGKWDLDKPLFQISPYDVFTQRNAEEAVAIFGELGAAKTTGSAAHFLTSYLAVGMGGLYLCCKPGDRELIEIYARLTGRTDSLIIVSPQTPWRCNIMRYALMRPGAIGSRVEQLVSLLMTIVDAAERGEKGGGGSNDKFFQRALRQILRNGIEVCLAARGGLSMALLHEVISSAPRTHEEVHNPEWQKRSVCYQLIEEAEARERSASAQRDFELAAKYFLREYPDMPNDTRGSVLATYGVLADVLLRGHMADLFDDKTNFVPDVSFEGAIIVLDLPIKIYGQAGVYAQAAFTYLWQLAAEQRDVTANPRPTFWFADEFQEFICEYTPRFLATARGARVASVLITQNISNYFAAMGGESGRDIVEATLGNTGTKIFHANGHSQTNKWASDVVSEELQTRGNWHSSGDPTGRGGGGGSESVGRKILPSEFTSLRKGGAKNGFITEAILYQTGASFEASGGQPYLRTSFKQLIPGVTVPVEGW